jgi:hypothetical protein
MKRFIFLALALVSFAFVNDHVPTNSKEVAELFKQYPTHKSTLCTACVEWDNPYYKAIADTVQNYPVCSFMVYTREHAHQEDSLQAVLKAELKASGKSSASGRSGILSAWHCLPGQPNTLFVYKEANQEIGKPNTPYEIALGHVQAWILCAWSRLGAIFSDVPTFNAGMEFQGQNVGTEIWTETHCRDLVEQYDTVFIWGGCTGAQGTYTAKGVKVTVPAYYWKVIKYAGQTECWYMPNQVGETQDKISKRVKDLAYIKQSLGFDPTKIFQAN